MFQDFDIYKWREAASLKFADCLDATFGEGKRVGLCGHPEIELALMELYRETNDACYLKLAEYFAVSPCSAGRWCTVSNKLTKTRM